MRFKKYSCVKEFYNDTYEVLLRDEAQNMILLGNVIIGYVGIDKTGWRDPVNWMMATVSDKGFKKCALYTDLSNPTSNSIYTKIGDVPVCDSLVLKFE